MSIKQPGIAGILWALFWIGVVLWIINDPTGAAQDVRSLAGWVIGGVQSFVTFLRTVATG
jgi:hypothetical protein